MESSWRSHSALDFPAGAAELAPCALVVPRAHAALGSCRATIGNKKGPVCAQKLPGAWPGFPTQARARGARSWGRGGGGIPNFSKSPKVINATNLYSDATAGPCQPLVSGRTPRSSQEEDREDPTAPILLPGSVHSSLGPEESPPPFHTRRPVSLRSHGPIQQLPRGERPCAGPEAPSRAPLLLSWRPALRAPRSLPAPRSLGRGLGSGRKSGGC
jgi:hypothetical protein